MENEKLIKEVSDNIKESNKSIEKILVSQLDISNKLGELSKKIFNKSPSKKNVSQPNRDGSVSIYNDKSTIVKKTPKILLTLLSGLIILCLAFPVMFGKLNKEDSEAYREFVLFIIAILSLYGLRSVLIEIFR